MAVTSPAAAEPEATPTPAPAKRDRGYGQAGEQVLLKVASE